MWITKYMDAFAGQFDVEQDYIDAAFMLIVLYNFGIFTDTSRYLRD